MEWKLGVQLLRSNSTMKMFVDALVKTFTTISIINGNNCKKNHPKLPPDVPCVS